MNRRKQLKEYEFNFVKTVQSGQRGRVGSKIGKDEHWFLRANRNRIARNNSEQKLLVKHGKYPTMCQKM